MQGYSETWGSSSIGTGIVSSRYFSNLTYPGLFFLTYSSSLLSLALVQYFTPILHTVQRYMPQVSYPVSVSSIHFAHKSHSWLFISGSSAFVQALLLLLFPLSLCSSCNPMWSLPISHQQSPVTCCPSTVSCMDSLYPLFMPVKQLSPFIADKKHA